MDRQSRGLKGCESIFFNNLKNVIIAKLFINKKEFLMIGGNHG